MRIGLHNTETDIETLFQQTPLEVSAIEYLDYGTYLQTKSIIFV
jgi:hypothetical protein